MRLSDQVVIDGDLNITDNLILSKISDDGNAITLTNDSSTRTITGTGSLEASTLSQTPNASLTGMTGEIGSAVTGSPNLNLTTGLANASTTFPAGHIIKTNLKYILKDAYSSSVKSWQTAETHTNIMTGLTNGNRLRVQFDGFKLIASQGSYAYCLFSVFPNGTTDDLSNATGKKFVQSDYINSQSRGYFGALTVDITVAAPAYDAKLYYVTEDAGHLAYLRSSGHDSNGNDTHTHGSGAFEATYTTGASMACYEIQG